MEHKTTGGQGDRNKALVRLYLKAYETGRQAAVNHFLHAHHTFHPPGGAAVMARHERIRDEAVFFRAFSNIRTRIAAQIAEGPLVASRVQMVADHTGMYQKFPPTGRPVSFAFMDVVVVSAGKIREEWAELDMLTVLEQLRINARTRKAG